MSSSLSGVRTGVAERQAADHVQHLVAQAPVARHGGADGFDVDAEHGERRRLPRSCRAPRARRALGRRAGCIRRRICSASSGKWYCTSSRPRFCSSVTQVDDFARRSPPGAAPAPRGRHAARGPSAAAAPRRRRSSSGPGQARSASAARRTPSSPSIAMARRIVSTGPLPATCVPRTCAELTARSSSKRQRQVLAAPRSAISLVRWRSISASRATRAAAPGRPAARRRVRRRSSSSASGPPSARPRPRSQPSSARSSVRALR